MSEPALQQPALSKEELDEFTSKLIIALKTVLDPEIPVDIYELGLIYKVDVADNKDVTVDMTLTAPGCPVAGEMPNMVRDALLRVPGIGSPAPLTARIPRRTSIRTRTHRWVGYGATA